MTVNSNDYVDFVMDQLASLRGISSGRFFGGVGLSADGIQFGMIMGSSLYFVVDDSSREKYEKMGSGCFSYLTKKGRIEVRKYYNVPVEMIEDQEQLVALARESIGIAGSKNIKKKSAAKLSKQSRLKRASALRRR